MTTVEIDQSDIIQKLPRLAPKVNTAVREGVTQATADLRNGVRAAVANIFHSTGPLYQSIDSQIENDVFGTTGTVFSQKVVYAAAQEYGGTWEIPEIFPKNKLALAFSSGKIGFSSGGGIGGETIFAKHTKAHPVTLPARSYARSTLFQMKGQIEEEISSAVLAVL